MNNRKARLLFIKDFETFRISNRKWLLMEFLCIHKDIYKSKPSRSQKKRFTSEMLMAEDYDDDEFWTSIHG